MQHASTMLQYYKKLMFRHLLHQNCHFASIFNGTWNIFPDNQLTLRFSSAKGL